MNVQLFGVLREAAGSSAIEIAIDQPTTVTAILDQLIIDYPGLATHLPRIACAVGDEMRLRADVIEPTETLVLLPPVSGG